MLLILTQNKKGVSLVEILIVIAILSIGLLSVLTLGVYSMSLLNHFENNTSAVYLATDILEGIRNIRDEDWNNISTITMGADYYPVQSGVSPDWYWELQPGSELVNAFYTRQVVFENVSRDSNDNIETTYNPANDDPDTKKVRAVVSWSRKGTTQQIEIVTYLTNWR